MTVQRPACVHCSAPEESRFRKQLTLLRTVPISEAFACMLVMSTVI